MKKILLLFFICFFMTGCAADKNTDDTTAAVMQAETYAQTTQAVTEPPTETTTADPVLAVLDSMTLDEKIGQMFIVAYRTENGVPVLTPTENIKADIAEYQPGGFILFDENINNTQQLKSLINDYKSLSHTVPFIAIDEEGGAVSRLGSSGILADYSIPSARSMAAAGKDTVAENYHKIALNLKSLGFNMDFAPDADVDTNPANPVIGNRAFGSDPDTAAEMMLTAMQTLRQNGIVPVIKHFPGHGDTQSDSHLGLTIMPHDMQRLESVELVPFKAAIADNAPAIMAAHLTTPAISNSGLPATLNKDILTGLLREKLGYGGVIVTDAMDMGAITTQYSCADSTIMAINAGADIVLMPPDPGAAFEAVKSAVNDGRISEERIDASVYRILKIKSQTEGWSR